MIGADLRGDRVTGTDTAARRARGYLHPSSTKSLVDGSEYGSQAVVGKTSGTGGGGGGSVDSGAWSGLPAVLGPEALPPRPFLDLLNDYGSPGPSRSATHARCRRICWSSTLVGYSPPDSAWRTERSMTSSVCCPHIDSLVSIRGARSAARCRRRPAGSGSAKPQDY